MNNKFAQTLTRRLALVLIVSILNCVISPLFPGVSSNVKAAPFDDPTAFIRRIPKPHGDFQRRANDLGASERRQCRTPV